MGALRGRHILRRLCIFWWGCLLAGCDQSVGTTGTPRSAGAARAAVVVKPAPRLETAPASSPIVAAARAQVGRTMIYDPSYARLAYPGGDVAIERGVCTDVVIRAFRDALGMDLQKLVHEDMKAAGSGYPRTWGLRKPDPNIDHRRVPNLQKYFERKGWSVAVTGDKADYLPGDLVTCMVCQERPHIMIVSDRKTRGGVPLVIHNIGLGAKEEGELFAFPLTGHYRIKAGGANDPTDKKR